jgi:hypothetical protein
LTRTRFDNPRMADLSIQSLSCSLRQWGISLAAAGDDDGDSPQVEACEQAIVNGAREMAFAQRLQVIASRKERMRLARVAIRQAEERKLSAPRWGWLARA